MWTEDQGIPQTNRGYECWDLTSAVRPLVLEAENSRHSVLLERIPSFMQSAWLLLLYARLPEEISGFALFRKAPANLQQAHDAGLWQCLCAILRRSQSIS